LGACFNENGSPYAEYSFPSFPLANAKAFFAVQTIDAVDARELSLPPEEDEKATIAETTALIG
jgi:hypothetical protein